MFDHDEDTHPADEAGGWVSGGWPSNADPPADVAPGSSTFTREEGSPTATIDLY